MGVGVVLSSTGVDGEEVGIVFDGEREAPRNRRDNERDEPLRDRSRTGVDAEREGAREGGFDEEL